VALKVWPLSILVTPSFELRLVMPSDFGGDTFISIEGFSFFRLDSDVPPSVSKVLHVCIRFAEDSS